MSFKRNWQHITKNTFYQKIPKIGNVLVFIFDGILYPVEVIILREILHHKKILTYHLWNAFSKYVSTFCMCKCSGNATVWSVLRLSTSWFSFTFVRRDNIQAVSVFSHISCGIDLACTCPTANLMSPWSEISNTDVSNPQSFPVTELITAMSLGHEIGRCCVRTLLKGRRLIDKLEKYIWFENSPFKIVEHNLTR